MPEGDSFKIPKEESEFKEFRENYIKELRESRKLPEGVNIDEMKEWNQKQFQDFFNKNPLLNPDAIKKYKDNTFFGRISNGFKSTGRMIYRSGPLGIFVAFAVSGIIFAIVEQIIVNNAAKAAKQTSDCYYKCMPSNYKSYQKSSDMEKKKLEPTFDNSIPIDRRCSAENVKDQSNNEAKFLQCKEHCDNLCCDSHPEGCENYIKKNQCTAGIKKTGCPSRNPLVNWFNQILGALGITAGSFSLVIKGIIFLFLTGFNFKVAGLFEKNMKLMIFGGLELILLGFLYQLQF